MKDSSVKMLTKSAMIAALYAVLTLASHGLGLANGQIQIRLSEALTILPVFTPAAIPGLFVGCILSNILTGAAIPDIIFGSLATLLGALGSRALKSNKYLAVIPPIAANTVIIPLLLFYIYGIVPLWLSFITVFAGEIVSAGVLAILLYNGISKNRDRLSL
ncbi:MAG: QueT transporter family protein [Lachnospiraceae bacterium]|nr:QueT transporter family protein [Lachnospiraceae bacterium]